MQMAAGDPRISMQWIGIVAPFFAGLALVGVGAGSARLLRARYDLGQIAEERGGAGCLLTATIGSLLLALLAFGMGLYAVIVYWIIPH
jgi:hypothetical protein